MDSKNNRQRKIDIIQTFFLDDILDLWDYIKTFKVYYPNILYYANETDYFIFIINCLLDGPNQKGIRYNRHFKDPEEKLIYTKIYQVTNALIETIFKKLPFLNTLQPTDSVGKGISSDPDSNRSLLRLYDGTEVCNWIDDYSELL